MLTDIHDDSSPVPWPGFAVLGGDINVGDVAFLVDLSLAPGHNLQVILGHIDRGALDLVNLLALLPGAEIEMLTENGAF